MTNYIDYMLLNFYIGNTDWPWHNFYAAIDTADPTGFKFFNWDAEMSLGMINGGFNSNRQRERAGANVRQRQRSGQRSMRRCTRIPSSTSPLPIRRGNSCSTTAR